MDAIAKTQRRIGDVEQRQVADQVFEIVRREIDARRKGAGAAARLPIGQQPRQPSIANAKARRVDLQHTAIVAADG
ncbi:MAG TPA: hypothetical protein VGR52_09645 [Stellaceae bacterium]|nr:hypothetical protein [Stellaceae bacterium]